MSQDQNRCPKQLNHVTRPAPRYSAINAAIAVATDRRTTATDAIEGVANLAEKSLLTTDITSNITRLRLRDTTRAYALEKLTESGEVDDAARRSAAYFRDMCAPAPPGAKLVEAWVLSPDWVSVERRRQLDIGTLVPVGLQQLLVPVGLQQLLAPSMR